MKANRQESFCLLMSPVQWLCMLGEYKRNRLQTLLDAFLQKHLFCTGCRENTGLDNCSHPGGHCLHPWVMPQATEEERLHHKLLQDRKSLDQGQPSFLTQWVAFRNPRSTTLDPLAWEAGGWKALRRRSQMGNNFVSPGSPQLQHRMGLWIQLVSSVT